jgi:ribosome maturation factor RimP
VDRPLTRPRHWRRNLDRLVKVTLDGGATLEGRIVAASDDSVSLDVSGTQREVSYAQVTKALVQIEFNRKKKDGE